MKISHEQRPPEKRKIITRLVLEIAFLIAFAIIWIPNAIPNQQLILLFWNVYHWPGLDYYFRLIDSTGILVGSAFATLSVIVLREYRSNSKAVQRIPIRIHVTGIRGKSTTTRLIGAVLRHSGLRTITKTTGKAATLIDEHGAEHRIRDHRVLPNLREQPRLIQSLSATRGTIDAIVFECMSIRPKNIIAESEFVMPTISVITNVRADHLDVMGPKLDDVARCLSGIIKKNSIVVTAEKQYLDIIRRKAKEVGASKVVEVDPERIIDDILPRFSYMIFKENIAIALEVSDLLGIREADAFDGMVEAKPDPGLTRILDAQIGSSKVRFIAAFGVNDVDSTKMLFEELVRRQIIEGRKLIGMFHARDDRVTRTLDFSRFMSKMPFENILVVGKMTKLFVTYATWEGYPKKNIIDLGPVDVHKLIGMLEIITKSENRDVVLFGCGNMIGIESFIEEFEKMGKSELLPIGVKI